MPAMWDGSPKRANRQLKGWALSSFLGAASEQARALPEPTVRDLNARFGGFPPSQMETRHKLSDFSQQSFLWDGGQLSVGVHVVTLSEMALDINNSVVISNVTIVHRKLDLTHLSKLTWGLIGAA